MYATTYETPWQHASECAIGYTALFKLSVGDHAQETNDYEGDKDTEEPSVESNMFDFCSGIYDESNFDVRVRLTPL